MLQRTITTASDNSPWKCLATIVKVNGAAAADAYSMISNEGNGARDFALFVPDQLYLAMELIARQHEIRGNRYSLAGQMPPRSNKPIDPIPYDAQNYEGLNVLCQSGTGVIKYPKGQNS